MLRRQVKIIALLVLIGAVINSAMSFYWCAGKTRHLAILVNDFGPEAAQHQWPGPTPKGQPAWSAPTQYDVEGTFGHTHYNVFGEPKPGQNGLQMETDEYGWPFASFTETSRWWPQNDPAWATTDEQQVPLRPVWKGMLLNPIIVGVGAWLLLAVPFLVSRALKLFNRHAGALVVRHAMIALVLVLIAAAANLPVATLFIPPFTRAMPMGKRLKGAEAASQSWPDQTPRSQPAWPKPSSFDVSKEFGRSFFNVRYNNPSVQGKNGHSMSTQQFGWPLRTLARTNRWWDWDNPTWKTEERPELPLHVIWTGAILNPLIAGLGIWLIAFAPPLISRSIRERLRRHRNQCLNCGYPAVASGVCPECGAPTTHPLPATT